MSHENNYRRDHRTRPPDPTKAVKSHGKRPPAPKPHRSSGKSSSSATGPIIGIAYALLVVPLFGATLLGLYVYGVF